MADELRPSRMMDAMTKFGYVNLLLFYASLRCGKTTQKIKLSLKHSNSLAPCLNIYWVDFGEFRCKITKFGKHVFY